MRVAIVGYAVTVGDAETAAEELRKTRFGEKTELRFFRTKEELRAEEKAAGTRFHHVAKTPRGLKNIVTKSRNNPF
jgi:hypothetical protein